MSPTDALVRRLSFLSDVPIVGSQLRRGWRAWRYHHIRLGWRINAWRAPSNAPLRPTNLLRVSTDRITHRVSPEPFDRDDTGRVVGGDWDQQLTHLTRNDSLYEGLVDRYEQGIPWRETNFYTQQLERIERGERAWGCSTIGELRTRYESLDDVYESMRTEGYQSARELVDGPTWRALDEIGVHVARDGELLFAGDGNHRIRLAKLLELDTVVVRILVRHADWQATRDRIAGGGVTPEQLDLDPTHPDLRNL